MPYSPQQKGMVWTAGVAALLVMVAATAVGTVQPPRVDGRVRHSLTASLDPATHRLAVTDTITLPAQEATGGTVDFVLNAALRITRSEPAVREVPLGTDATFFGINGASETAGQQVRVKRYTVATTGRDAGATTGGDAPTLRLSYEGRIDFGLSDAKEQYTRGFRETAGILGEEGVYLAGSGFWYPSFNHDLLEFALDVEQPAGWHVISQGNGTSRDERGRARWESGGPMDEIYLVGGPLQVFRDTAGAVETLVYLHDRDQALAGKYLAATSQYLEMYRQLIGPYPYGKFALVENFWETGYGMPTFTLLGREIIRFPFIINSSYPHEILHNWWGNSVFVDYESGNWCEGLTAYLADHLMQEQRGAGAEYRRSTLQKYRDYVKEGRDFPLTAFRSRESASTEAVGYGKAMMAFHMLRRQVGDDVFRKLLARFYRDFKGQRASFGDLQRIAEAVSGSDLARFFAQWVGRAGAPAFGVRVLSVTQIPAMRRVERPGRPSLEMATLDYRIEGALMQAQGGEPFVLDVPIVVQTTNGAVRREVHVERPETFFALTTPDPPLALQVDPDFDVFRKLDARETPASIGQIFGEPRILAVLPSSAPPEELQAWRELFQGWTSGSHAIEMKLDTEVAELPPDRAAWIAGKRTENTWAARAASGQAGGVDIVDPQKESAGSAREAVPPGTTVRVWRHPRNPEKAIGWIDVRPRAAFPGLGRKLPHYGKYSYLRFEGDEPVNTEKGQGPASDSPLRIDLRDRLRALQLQDGEVGAGRAPATISALPPAARKPLVELPPVFSQAAMLEHVAFLADPAREGRDPGSAGHDAAAKYIAAKFKEYGLAPGGDGGSYYQELSVAAGGTPAPPSVGAAPAPPRTVRVANVIGYLPGTKPEWKDQSVIVCAHYDHLGRGWPDVHKGDEGKVHPGADDNASGVAVMLELARALAGSDQPSRSIVFIAFTAEEAGLLGSKHYTEHAGGFPVAKAIGAINLDTVGRLSDGSMSVLGTGTATEWQHIFRGASFVTGVESRNVPESIQASDQVSFVRKGVPAVQIFTGAHPEYHRPGDTPDKIDGPGLVKVAAFVREGVSYLAERAEPLTVTIAGTVPPASQANAQQAPPAASARRVSFGTVPDFAFAGPGVRVTSVVPGSPAEKAGVQSGDVLVSLEGHTIANLQAYSELLRTLAPGQAVKAVILRAGKEVALSVTLAER